MNPRPRHLRWAALALAATVATGCRRPAEPSESTEPAAPALAEETPTASKSEPTPAPERTPEPVPAGRHALTASPPATAADLDRLLNVGFTPDEILSEVARRGVLRRPDAGERSHILTLPRGERLLDAMEAPQNLLSPAALTLFADNPSGLRGNGSWQANQNAAANYAYLAQGRAQSVSPHDQLMNEYRRRLDELTRRIAQLRKQRTGMQQRGEMIATITLEIERLEREAASLVPPP